MGLTIKMLNLIVSDSMRMCKALIVITYFLAGTSFASDSSRIQKSESDEWVVVLKDPRPARLSGFNVRGYTAKHYSNSLELKRFGKRVAKEYDLRLKKAWFIDSLKVYCIIVEVDPNKKNVLSTLEQDERVDWVQRSNRFELLKSTSKDAPSSVAEVATLFDQMDGLGVRIALIDSAVSRQHPELLGSISVNRDLVIGGEPSNAIGERHGTAMAGILVASPQTGLGIRGVAPAAQVLAYRGCWENDSGGTQCNTLSLARALDDVIKAAPSILNLSLSGPRDRLLDSLINKLVAKNVFIVAAFDPSRTNNNRFPARRNGVLIVRAEHMHQGFQNEFTAPGRRIVVSPDTNYQSMNGHSVATAYTSGVLALMAQISLSEPSVDLNDLVDAQGRPNVSNIDQLLKLKRNTL